MGRCFTPACWGIAFLWATSASALESNGFTLETGSPDALCPALEAAREAVARRLGSLVVEGRKGWLARYTIGHAPAGTPRDFLRLEVFNPQGELELRRDLPIEGDSCPTMAEVIALVLDRHFRGLVAAERDPSEAPEPARPEQPPAMSSARAPTPAVVTRVPLEPATAPRFELSGPRLSAEYAASLGEPALGARVAAGVFERFEVTFGLRWALTALQESEPNGVRVTARGATSRAGIAWRLALPPGLLHVGPTVSLGIQRASARGLKDRTDQTRAVWSAGVEAGFVAPLGRGLFVEASTSLDFAIPGAAGQFVIDDREVLASRTLTIGWAVGFGYAWGK